MRKLSITVFLEQKCGNGEGKDNFPPFLCSLTLNLNLQVIRQLQFMICVSCSSTLNADGKQESEELRFRFLQTSEKAFIEGGMKYNKKSEHQGSMKKSVLNLTQITVFHVFHCGPSVTQIFLF